MEDLSNQTYEEKKAEREREEMAARADIEKKKKIRKVFNFVAVVSIIAVACWGGYKLLLSFGGIGEKPGEAISIQPADHIKPGDLLPGLYLSNPPVSGWHYAETAKWGVHNEEIVDQLAIHNLEHGGIWISYKPDAPSELVGELKTIAERYRDEVILSPRAANDSLIALAAWGRLDKFDYFDEARIVKFIKAYRGKGQERF